MKDYTIIYNPSDIEKINKTKKGQIACYICVVLLVLIISVVLYVFIENDVLYLISALFVMLLFVTYSLYMFLLKFPKINWYYNLFTTLEEGYKSITPLSFIEVKENDDKTKKVLFKKLENDEEVELLILNHIELDLKKQNYYISHVGKNLYGFKEYE